MATSLVAQQSFDFSLSTNKGCTPLLVTFTNTTDPTIIGNYRYEWVVEAGKFSTETYQVENSYLQPGIYTAQMKAFDPVTNVLVGSVSKQIQAFRDPDVQITASKTEGCVYKPFQFSITSKTSDSPIVSYMWIVSDGSTYPMETPPAHSFTYPATHNIFCAVTDANGCTNRERHTIQVTTYNDAPTTSFTSDKNSVCDPYLQVQFTNTSPADPNLDHFEWIFGDGSTNTTTKNPSHTYNGYGTYYAQLKNTSIHECEATASQTIRLIDYQPDFTIADEIKPISGNKACHGEITFTDNSLPANSTISYSWDYGADGSVDGTKKTFSKSELSSGLKQVKLTVNNGVCTKSITKSFEVEVPLQIGYSPSDEFFCEQAIVPYNANSNIPNSSFMWIINGDTLHGQTPSYSFASEGLYSDALYVTSPNSCRDSLLKPNNIELVFPTIELSLLTKNSGCVPLSAAFGEVSTYNTTRDDIAKIEWDFNYENDTFTTDATGFGSAGHTYTERGVYQAAVKATTTKGCVIYDYAKEIPGEKEWVKAGEKPRADLTFPDTVMCASDKLKSYYVNGNPDAPMNSGWDTLFLSFPHWYPNNYPMPNNTAQAPGGMIQGESMLRDSVGEHSVWFTLSDHGCKSNPQQDYDSVNNKFTTIHVHGPILDILPSPKDCNDNYHYNFSFRQKINVDYSSPNQGLNWYLKKKGVNVPPMFLGHNLDEVKINFQDTIHPYFYENDGRGDYEIIAKAWNEDEICYPENTPPTLCHCTDEVKVEIKVTDIKADFKVPNATPCLGDSAFVQIGNLAQDVEWGKTYWLRNGEQFYADTMRFHFDDRSIRRIEVITADVFNCPASAIIPIKIYQPEANFQATITSDCLPFATEFSDLTSWDSDTTITRRWWDFGNGKTSTDSTAVTQYTEEGLVSPSLKVQDILGCVSTITKQNYIKPIVPNSKFTVATPQLCLNHDAIITRDFSNPAYDNNIHTFTWDFGDGSTITGNPSNPQPEYILSDTVRHRYTQESIPGKFTISLTAYSVSPIDATRECTATTTSAIEVKDVSAQIMIRDMDKCKEPGQVFITYIDNAWYSGKYKSTEWYKTDDGARTLVSNANIPRAITFLNYGTQNIELITHSNYYGCEIDTARQQIIVPGYEVEFEADKYLLCVNEDVTFTRTHAVNVDAYTSYWSFGDGVMNFTNLEQTTHAYSTLPDTDNERFRVQYIVDAPNCKPRDIFQLIELHPVEANFLRGIGDLDSIGCAPRTVNFINTSVGAKANSYRWNFGDGTTSTDQNPTHTFADKKTPYEVSLSIDGVVCNDETSKKLYFFPKPTMQFDYDSVICVGEHITINAQGDFSSISWTPKQHFSHPNAPTTLHTPPHSGKAYAEIVSQYGCVEHDSLFVFVQQRPRYQGAPDSALLYYRTPHEMILASRPDSKLIAGQIYNVNNTPIDGTIYEWSPSDFLSCTNCISPNIHLECGSAGTPSCLDFPLDVQYTIRMYDTLGCFEESENIKFLIVVETKAALPQAFTPNGDGNNDIAFVRGWGIKEFLELRIYNRWGQLIFESNDLNHGWDGRYNGKDQPMETYSYTIRYIDSKNENQFVKGYITLLR
jgi:gliding motility-associated-like protein